MDARGLIRADCGEFWLGAVFRGKEFEWTGQYLAYTDDDRNIHRGTIKVWRLRAPSAP
jgi:hypothetical protein